MTPLMVAEIKWFRSPTAPKQNCRDKQAFLVLILDKTIVITLCSQLVNKNNKENHLEINQKLLNLNRKGSTKLISKTDQAYRISRQKKHPGK